MNLQTNFNVITMFGVFLAGGTGVLARCLVLALVPTLSQPLIIFGVNLLGSFGIGLLSAIYLQKQWIGSAIYFMLTAGFLGGFTTFSSLSLDLLEYLKQGRLASALFLALGSVFLGVLAAFAGFQLLRD